MIRVVVDTNVLVSALLNRHGVPAQLVSLVFTSSEFEPCVSSELFAEYEEVLRRPKFNRGEDQVLEMLNGIRTGAFWVQPEEAVTICVDRDDNMVLECAQAAQARYVITGNLRHFPEGWREIRIVNPREFTEIFV